VLLREKGIPRELRQLPQWVGWRSEMRDGKPTKAPTRPDGDGYAKVSDPTTWGSLPQVQRASIDGVGFVFSDSDPYCGIDLDGCREFRSGELAPWARAVLRELDSYAEVSPSKTGIHVIVKARLAEEGRRWGSIEIYDRGRYFTMTGVRAPEAARQIQNRQKALEALLPALQLLGRSLGRGAGDVKWLDLFAGRWEEHGYDSQSNADLALLSRIVGQARDRRRGNLTPADVALVERVFGWSGLAERGKWEREDYRKRTMERALQQSEQPERAPRSTLEGAIEFERNRRQARRLLDAEEADRDFREPSSVDSVAEWMELDLPPLRWRVQDLLAEGDNALLAALFKSGKTTLVLNLLRSLCDRTAFLGQFPCDLPQDRRVALWNLEVSERRIWQWVREMRFEHPERLSALNLRGYPVDFRSSAFRAWTRDWLQRLQIQVWVVDPFAAGFRGDENSNTDVRDFLAALDAVKAEAEVGELLLVHHFGRVASDVGEEHGRGATRLDDWPDSRWVLSKVKKQRYFAATGRDVEVDEAPIEYDLETRTVSFLKGAGGRAEEDRVARELERSAALAPRILGFLSEHPDSTYNELWRALSGVRNEVRRRAISVCEMEGQITKKKTRGNRSLYSLAPRALLSDWQEGAVVPNGKARRSRTGIR
jgi:hypothetical protein